MKESLSTESYKGVRDFYPEDEAVHQYILSTMANTAESFGYEAYNASLLEPTEVYQTKTSEEIVNEQTYTFMDRGGRSVTLRPEMTPTVARLIAGRAKEFSWPKRWYSIPNVFRYEKPQRGRLREHWQLNVDVFGIDSLSAEKEVIHLAATILRNFGLHDEQFRIELNDRRALDNFLTQFTSNDEAKTSLRRLLDTKVKITETEFQKRWRELTDIPFAEMYSEPESVAEIRQHFEGLGFTNVVFNPAMVRGFDYYTGIVFEVFDESDLNNRSLFGGGRYDNLLDIFDMPRVPAVGFGMGDVTMHDVLDTYNLLPGRKRKNGLYLAVLSSEHALLANKLAQYLRDNGVSVATDLRFDKAQNQIKRALKDNYRYLVLFGEEEVTSNRFRLKNLAAEHEQELSADDIIDQLASLEA